MIRAYIVEDEPQGRNNLKNFLDKHCGDVQIVAEAGSVAEGLQHLNNDKLEIDLAFMDIKLSDGLIFQLLDQLNTINFDIIFVTAFERFAIEACNYSSIGYILKPIDADELQKAVNRVRAGKNNHIEERLEIFKQIYNNPNVFTKMSISALDGIYFVNIQDIIRFEADDNYTNIYLENGKKITASKTIKSYEELLEHANFYRVHKRHVINLNYMHKYVKGDGGYLVMDDGMKIEVSRRRRPAFMEQIRRLQGGV